MRAARTKQRHSVGRDSFRFAAHFERPLLRPRARQKHRAGATSGACAVAQPDTKTPDVDAI